MLGNLSSAIGVLIAVLSTVISSNASEQHGFIRITAFCFQFGLHLIPAQPATKDLVRTLYHIMSGVSTDKLWSAHRIL